VGASGVPSPPPEKLSVPQFPENSTRPEVAVGVLPKSLAGGESK